MEAASNGYSARVRLRLFVGENAYELAQVGSGYVIFRERVDLPVCDAWLSVIVDGEERRKRIRLVHGAQPFDPIAETVSC